MPSFYDSADAQAPPEEVWKLLYDPARFPDWWTGIAAVDVGEAGEYTMYPDGYPDFPMAQLLESKADGQRVMVSCLVNDLRFEWRLEPLDDDRTRISVEVQIPDSEAERLDSQRGIIRASLGRLARLATEA